MPALCCRPGQWRGSTCHQVPHWGPGGTCTSGTRHSGTRHLCILLQVTARLLPVGMDVHMVLGCFNPFSPWPMASASAVQQAAGALAERCGVFVCCMPARLCLDCCLVSNGWRLAVNGQCVGSLHNPFCGLAHHTGMHACSQHIWQCVCVPHSVCLTAMSA